MWKENGLNRAYSAGSRVLYEAIPWAASHHDFMEPRWHVGGFKHYSTRKCLLDSFFPHFSAVSVIVSSLVSGLPLHSLEGSLSLWKPCLVKYQVIFTVTCTVLSPPHSCASSLLSEKGLSSFWTSNYKCLKGCDSVLLLTNSGLFFGYQISVIPLSTVRCI